MSGPETDGWIEIAAGYEARLVKAEAERDVLVNALRNARNYIDAVVVNTPDKKKRRNYSECLRIVDDALKPFGTSFEKPVIPVGTVR